MNVIEKFSISIIVLIIPHIVVAQTEIKNDFSKKNGYEITGHIEGLKEGEKVTMHLSTGGFDFIKQDSALVKNGEFHITGFVPQGPRFYQIQFEYGKIGMLYIDNGERITINSDRNIRKIPHGFIEHYLTVEGSPTNAAAWKLVPLVIFYKHFMKNLKRQLHKIKDSIGFNGPLLDEIFAIREQINQEFSNQVLFHEEEDLGPGKLFFIDDYISMSDHASFLVGACNNLNEIERNSFYGKKLKEYLPLCVGQKFPGFTLPTSDGKSISLDDVISKSKITLVHFWGSADYTSPRSLSTVKQYQADLRAMYQKYHSKGLNIIGVAAEDSASLYSYNKVIREQQLLWPNVSDLKGNMKGSIINDIYKEGGNRLPNVTNYLLDADGKIIAYDPNGVTLQWYLWKAFGE